MNEKNISAPAISIITPMYNSEKYVAELLESVLNQTFKNYEMILVDDCSTDNSREVAENYISEFFGDQASKIKLIASEKNSGTPSIPKNIGIRAARGEYIMFVDSDDALSQTALEELYSIAKEYDADVLASRRFYMFHGESVKNPTRISARGVDIKGVIPVNDPLTAYSKRQFTTMTWTYFFKREPIVQNNVEFPNIPMTEDGFFNLFALFFAKKVFRISNLYYYYRKHPESLTADKVPLDRYISIRLESVIRGLKLLEEFDKQYDLFKGNADVRYATFKRFVLDIMGPMDGKKIYQKISVQEFNEFIQKALQKIDDRDFLTTFLFNYSSTLRVDVNERDSKIKKLQEENQKLQEENKKLQENSTAN